jgi:hypothetical protein
MQLQTRFDEIVRSLRCAEIGNNNAAVFHLVSDDLQFLLPAKSLPFFAISNFGVIIFILSQNNSSVRIHSDRQLWSSFSGLVITQPQGDSSQLCTAFTTVMFSDSTMTITEITQSHANFKKKKKLKEWLYCIIIRNLGLLLYCMSSFL